MIAAACPRDLTALFRLGRRNQRQFFGVSAQVCRHMCSYYGIQCGFHAARRRTMVPFLCRVPHVCGINILTHGLARWHPLCVSSTTQKHKRLREAGLFNTEAEGVRDPLFQGRPEFFDAYDLLQVRYELLRARRVEHDGVGRLCERYGISRQTFYNLHEKFLAYGTAGLLRGKPGPHRASKLTVEIVGFARHELDRDEALSGAKLAAAIETRFQRMLHRRTIEKLIRNLRSKKNA